MTRTACRVYIFGVVQGVGLGDGTMVGKDGKMVERRKTIFCAPDNMQQDQLVDVFQRTMRLLERAYPDDLKSPAVSLVAAAMQRSYPCQR
jgi:hypothetical protein